MTNTMNVYSVKRAVDLKIFEGASPSMAYHVGVICKDKDWNELGPICVAVVTGNLEKTLAAVDAGTYWPRDRFNQFAENIVEAIEKSYGASYCACKNWDLELFKRYGVQLAKVAIKDPKLKEDLKTELAEDKKAILRKAKIRL